MGDRRGVGSGSATVGGPSVDAPDPEVDPEAKFEEVVEHIRAWSPDGATSHAAPQRLRLYLDRRLNGDATSVWDRDIVERRRGSSEADLVINGEIGLKLVRSVGPTTVKNVRVTLGLLAERYNYVAVYWLDAAPEEADFRRSVERGMATKRHGLGGLAFVTDVRRPARLPDTGWVGLDPAHLRFGVVAAVFAALATGALWWVLTNTTGFGQLLLFLVGGVFLGTLALGGFVASS